MYGREKLTLKYKILHLSSAPNLNGLTSDGSATVVIVTWRAIALSATWLRIDSACLREKQRIPSLFMYGTLTTKIGNYPISDYTRLKASYVQFIFCYDIVRILNFCNCPLTGKFWVMTFRVPVFLRVYFRLWNPVICGSFSKGRFTALSIYCSATAHVTAL